MYLIGPYLLLYDLLKLSCITFCYNRTLLKAFTDRDIKPYEMITMTLMWCNKKRIKKIEVIFAN